MLKKKSQVDVGSADGKPLEEGEAASNVLRLSRFGTSVKDVGANNLRTTFTLPANYRAYVAGTDEKVLLHKELARAYWAGELPIRFGDSNKRVLDLGCGLGTNTSVLLGLFDQHDVYAIDRSRDFLDYATSQIIDPNNNLTIEHSAFEDFTRRRFDFILCSHVLQYIDTELIPFIKKIYESLAAGGEVWIVLQEERGINELILASLPYLDAPSPYFKKWFVHDAVRKILMDMGVEIRSRKILSHFRAPNIDDPAEEDIALLNFILLNGFDYRNVELVNVLTSKIARKSRSGLIPHEVGITKFRRLA